jgi:hypothetical protein
VHFPYRLRRQHLFPIIPVTLSHQKRIFRTEGLLDSGANFSLFSAGIAEYLDISLETGKPIDLVGIGGRIRGYRHIVDLAIESVSFKAVIVFSAEFTSAFNLLGRDNFFEQFRVTFDERGKSVILDSIIG